MQGSAAKASRSKMNARQLIERLFARRDIQTSHDGHELLDPAAAAVYDDQSQVSVCTAEYHHDRDELELIAAAKEEFRRHSSRFKGRDREAVAHVLLGVALEDALHDVLRYDIVSLIVVYGTIGTQ